MVNGNRKAISFLVHHQRDANASLAKIIVEATAPRVRRILPERGPEYVDESSTAWHEQVERWVRACLRGGPSFYYALHEAPPPIWLREIQVLLTFRMLNLNLDERAIELPAMMSDADHWMGMHEPGNLDYKNIQNMEWFTSKLVPLLPILEPDFGFGDTEASIIKNLATGQHPREFAWPSMILGPEAVKRLGPDMAEKLPVRKIEPLAYGGVWVQVGEHPFQATKSDLAKVAAHLGVEPRK